MNFDFAQIKLIVGLGNVGNKYSQTRHNSGFEFVEYFAAEYVGEAFRTIRSYEAHVLSLPNPLSGIGMHLVKPTTMMNLSGKAVIRLFQEFKLNPAEMLLVHDDLDIKLGDWKLSPKSPAIHNGVASIEKSIGKEFWRLRLGVDNREQNSPASRMSGADYVLKKLNNDELAKLHTTFPKILKEFGI